jgi:hypothetical protein
MRHVRGGQVLDREALGDPVRDEHEHEKRPERGRFREFA